MKFSVIGTGYWGSNHVRVVAELVEAGVIDSLVLCDIERERVSELAETYGVEYTTEYAELADHGVDAATVATPSTTHPEVANVLLREGLDLLIEKPLALTSEDAWRIVETAREYDATLGVGHVFRYHPALKELKGRIDRGELGQIKYLNTSRFSFRVPRASTGALYSLAVHDVDIYRYLLDETPDAIYCRMDSHVREGIDETSTLVLEYADATGVINESWQVPVFGKRRDLVVVGSERSAYIDYLDDTVLDIYDANVTQRADGLSANTDGHHQYEVENQEPLRVEVEEFVAACERGVDPPASGDIGAETIEILELAEASNKRGEVVSIDR